MLSLECIKNLKFFKNDVSIRTLDYISIFVSPTDKTEIENIISSLDSNKSVGPNSIPTKVLKLL